MAAPDDSARIRGLLELARIVRVDEPLPAKLERIAAALAGSLGFGAVAISLHRPAWDDFQVAALHGSPQPTALELPLHDGDGRSLGSLAVDREVTMSEREVLEAFAAHAGQAIASAQAADDAARHQTALEQMLEVSSRLAGPRSADSVLAAVCEAARDALGFELAVVELADRDADRYRPVAAAGSDLSHADLQIEVSIAALDGMFDPAFEREGCYLLPRDEALARVSGEPTSYASSRNGSGPRAWNRHWLVAPWRDAAGAVEGFIWVDDPKDHLLPERPRLQALRLLANQAAAALEAASRYEALRAAEELHGSMLAASPAGFTLVGLDGRVRDWNDAARTMFGYADAEVIGQEPPWIGASGLPGFRERFADFVARGRVRAEVFHDRRADGTTIQVRTTSAPMRNSAGETTGVVAVIEDITEQLRAAADLERRNSELEALHATTLELLDRLDVGTTLDRIVQQAGELLGSDNGYLYLVDAQADELSLAVGRGFFSGHEGARLARGEGIGGIVLATGQPVTVDDYAAWSGRAGYFTDTGFNGAAAGVPLHSGGEVVGVLGVTFGELGRTFGEPEVALLRRFGRLASLALTNARLYEDLRSSQELYRTVVESSRDMLLLLDLDGCIRYASPSQAALLGYDDGELLGRGALGFVHPDDSVEAGEAVRAALAGGPATPDDMRVRHRSGHWIDVEGLCAPILGDDGRPRGILSVVRDVTERRRAEDARREAQRSLVREKERTERLIDSANAMIVGVGRDGALEVFNNEAERVTGYTHAGLKELDWLRLLTSPEAYAGARDLLTGAEPIPEAFEHAIVTRGGEERMISWRTRAILSPEGEHDGFIAFGLDQTERRDLEEQLRQAQKMEAIGQLAGGIAHDFNNLLTAITGYGDLAIARLDSADPVRRYVEEMRRAGERAAGLTRQLLAYSRKQVLQPKVLRLNEVVEGIGGMLSRLLGERVELSTRLDPELGYTRCDPGQIEQVLMNLAINARDAMPDGGRLTITTANIELDERFAREHVGAPPGEYVVLTVGDTGVGIDSVTLERVFDPFFTTKPPGAGTGLGLSTVYGIVKQTGGQVFVDSEPGEGTTFKVYLPRIWERSGERDAALDARGARAGRGTETVLLVEDEDVVRDLVREMLETDGYTVLQAARGAGALELARTHDGAIDVLMTDVVMPGLSGQQLAELLLAESPGIRVVFTSGYTEDAIANHGVLRPGTAFIEKPFSAPELARTLRSLFDPPLAA